jgi:hypothetical protein
MNKSQLFILAHSIAKHRSIAFYGSYQKAFGAVLKQLYAEGYYGATPGFQIHEPKSWLGFSRK